MESFQELCFIFKGIKIPAGWRRLKQQESIQDLVYLKQERKEEKREEDGGEAVKELL